MAWLSSPPVFIFEKLLIQYSRRPENAQDDSKCPDSGVKTTSLFYIFHGALYFQNLCDYKSSLPDFMLDLCDQVIKYDKAGLLRFVHLHRPVDQLLLHYSPPAKSLYWLYLDPQRNDHIVAQSCSVQGWTGTTQTQPTEPTQLTSEQYKQLSFAPNLEVLGVVGKDKAARLVHHKLNSIDQLRMLCESNHYFVAEDFLKDFFDLFNWTILYRAHSLKALQYITSLVDYMFDTLSRKNYSKKFEQKRTNDMLRLFKYELELKVETKEWPSIPTEFREYQPLSDFVPVPESRSDIIREKLKSGKVPVQCPADCACLRPRSEPFCKFSLVDGTWDTQCPNRAARIECNHLNEKEAEQCRNSEIKNKQRKSCRSDLSVEGGIYDIEQCIIWGIDVFTRKNIFYLLPEKELEDDHLIDNTSQKNRFIDECLLTAMNFLGLQGYDMLKVCDFIIQNSSSSEFTQCSESDFTWRYKTPQEDSNKMFKLSHNFYAKKLRDAVTTSPEKDAFRVHSKGKGARCLNKQGISASQFIVEYYGELYEPWRWYERQDFTKQFMKDMKMTEVPDFYNICLEKHSDEPQGMDMLMVDPIHKGNYSSRFSHSCNPNCGTIITVSEGRYYIGMYALRNIEYGEQLTFDYCSTTESNYEHKHAICLCGTKECRGNYLQLSNSKSLNNILDHYYCFMERNVVLVRSVEVITQQDLDILARHKLRRNILTGCPPWLVKWASLVMRFLEFECETQSRNLLKDMMDQRVAQHPLKEGEELLPTEREKMFAQVGKLELLAGRIQNLTTTIDKLKYYLTSIGDGSPPLLMQTDKEVLQVLWESSNSKEPSIMEEIKQLFERYGYQQELLIIHEISAAINVCDSDSEKLALVRYCFLMVSHHLQNNKCQHALSNGVLSDMLYMQSFTHHYFTPHEYQAHSSEEIVISPREFLNFSSKKEQLSRKKDFHDSRKYSSLFVWGQLLAWYKQTIAQPQASLSQDRRGTLSYPTLQTIVRSSTYPFKGNNRQNFLKTLVEKPHSSWPPERCPWSYKNIKKSYGTMIFQSFYSRHQLELLKVEGLQLSNEPGRKLTSAALQLIDKEYCYKLELFRQVERLITGRSDQQIEHLLKVFHYADGEFEESKRTFVESLVGEEKRTKKLKKA